MLDERQAFKAAFLHRCLQHGLSLEETHELVKEACIALEQPFEKQAIWPWLKANIPGLGTIAGIGSGLAQGSAEAAMNTIGKLGLFGYFGVPILGGGLAGYGLAKMRGINDEDPDEIKNQEKIEAYRRAAARAALQQQLHGSQQSRRPSRPLL